MSALDVIPLESAKEWLRVDFDGEDAKITELIKTAVEWVETYTGLWLWERQGTYNVSAHISYGCKVHLTAQPNLTIVSINGNTDDLPPVYGGYVTVNSGTETIVYKAGFATVDDIPTPLITAAKKFMALQYEETIDGQKEVPSEIRRLIDQYRTFTWF